MYITKKHYNLSDYVEKKHNLEEGIFANINNDISIAFTDINEIPPIIYMAYGYTRRSSSAGLFLQGIFNESEYLYQVSMFKVIQQNTAHLMNFKHYNDTIDFQEEAASMSIDFIQSYDQRLSRKIIFLMTHLAEKARDIIIHGPKRSYEDVLMTLTFTLKKHDFEC